MFCIYGVLGWNLYPEVRYPPEIFFTLWEIYPESKNTNSRDFFFQEKAVLTSPATFTATLCWHCVFKTAVSIQNPAKCEARAVIRFLHVK
jgi:hypothetical protein